MDVNSVDPNSLSLLVDSISSAIAPPRWREVMDFLNALLTPVIAFTVMYIAYRQHKLDKERHKLCLYEKRVELFVSLQNMLDFLSIVETPDEIDWDAFSDSRIKSISILNVTYFVVPPDVQAYIDEIHEKAKELYHFHIKSKAVEAAGREDAKLISEQQKTFDWLKRQSYESKNRFERYLGSWFE